MPCQYCPNPVPIDNSHVVSDFVVQWMIQNSPRGQIFFSWERAGFAHRMITGPYLCQQCEQDSSIFEGEFRQRVFIDPSAATNEWSTDFAIRFMSSLCYRYSIHHLFQGYARNAQEETWLMDFRQRAEAVLRDPTQLGNDLRIYPYAFRPITEGICELAPGANHALACSFGMTIIGAEPPLPMVMIVRIPRISMIFATGDLVATGDGDFANYVAIQRGVAFDPVNANTNFPQVFSQFINRSLGETQSHQRQTGRWTMFVDDEDERAHPERMVYQARAWDRQLELCQNANCGVVQQHG